MFVLEVCTAFERAKVRYAIVGGYAVALHGAVRGTVDVDVVLEWTEPNLIAAQRVLSDLGLKSRLPLEAKDVYAFRQEYIERRNLIAWNFYDPSNPTRQVDLIITYDLRNHAVVTVKTAQGKLRVLAREELIAMKREAGRPQDLEDVRALERHGDQS